MSQHLRRLAIAIWLISFVTPTSALRNGTIATGAEVALEGLVGIAYMFPIGLMSMPLQAISLLSNLLFIGELTRQVSKSNDQINLGSALLLISSAILNVSIGQHDMPLFPDILSYPGFYLWSSSFVLLASVAAYANRQFFSGLFMRSFALGAVATVVFFIGLAAILLTR